MEGIYALNIRPKIVDDLIIRPKIASMYFEKVLDDVLNCILIVVIPHCLNNVFPSCFLQIPTFMTA